jgi:hypothetical protein
MTVVGRGDRVIRHRVFSNPAMLSAEGSSRCFRSALGADPPGPTSSIEPLTRRRRITPRV